MKYDVKNLHSVARSYVNDNGQSISFAPGEQKRLKSRPPREQALWLVEVVEESQTPEDIKSKDGGDN